MNLKDPMIHYNENNYFKRFVCHYLLGLFSKNLNRIFSTPTPIQHIKRQLFQSLCVCVEGGQGTCIAHATLLEIQCLFYLFLITINVHQITRHTGKLFDFEMLIVDQWTHHLRNFHYQKFFILFHFVIKQVIQQISQKLSKCIQQFKTNGP